MQVNEIKSPNPNWDCTELKCEKTDIALRRYELIDDNVDNCVEYHLLDVDDESGEVISESVFEIIKKLLV